MVLETAIIAAAVITAAANLKASDTQSRSIRRGQTLEKEYRQRLFGLQGEQIAAGVPFRELARLSAELIGKDILRDPGTGATFERAATKGSENLAAQLAKFGILKSTAGGEAFGEFLGSLTAADLESIRGQRLGLLNLGQAGYGQTSNIASTGGASTGRSSNLAVAEGATQAAGISATGNTFAQLALLYGMNRQPTTTQSQGNVLNPGSGSLGGMLQTNMGG